MVFSLPTADFMRFVNFVVDLTMASERLLYSIDFKKSQNSNSSKKVKG
jgi:hypothetical protein